MIIRMVISTGSIAIQQKYCIMCMQMIDGEVQCEMVISNVKFLFTSHLVGFCVEYILTCPLHQVLGGM
jgi:hypothetical protein